MMEDRDYIVETLDELEKFARQFNKKELLERVKRTRSVYRQELTVSAS